MTFEKTRSVIRDYASDFRNAGHRPDRADLSQPLAWMTAKNHLLWMCEEALTWDESRKEKMMRWLGFIQGVLAIVEQKPIQELKEANAP